MFSHYSSFIPRTCIVRLGDICNAMRYSNQYSNVGLTIVVKVCCFTFWVHPWIFRLIKPSVLLALLVEAEAEKEVESKWSKYDNFFVEMNTLSFHDFNGE